jgi:uncharacterized membrane protein YgdD (TMEM256/DUF423 family)
MGVYEKAVFFHFVHSLGLLIVSVLPRPSVISAKTGTLVCSLLAAGVVLFCGSLYILAGTGLRVLGAVTPLGGLCFIAAWSILAIRIAKE